MQPQQMMMMLSAYSGIYLREHESSELVNVGSEGRSRPKKNPGELYQFAQGHVEKRGRIITVRCLVLFI